MNNWVWCRFHANADDYRPVKFPPPGPYWCTGYGDDYSIVVAYFLKKGWRKTLKEHWPEASNVEHEDREEITYSDRFTKPEWML